MYQLLFTENEKKKLYNALFIHLLLFVAISYHKLRLVIVNYFDIKI